MKKLLLATSVAFICAPAMAEDYRFEIESGYENTEFSKYVEETSTFVGGTFYLAPVDDSAVPKAEAAFLQRSSLVYLGWGETEVEWFGLDQDGDTWVLGGRYVSDTGLILEADYADGEWGDFDSELWGVGLGYYLTDTQSLTLSYAREEYDIGGDAEAEDDRWALGYKALFDNRFGLEADLGYQNPEYGADVYSINGALDYYLSEDLSLGGLLGYAEVEGSDFEVVTYGVKAEYFFNSFIAFNARYVVDSVDGGDDVDSWNIGLTGRF